jgi:hypothetical protein
MAEVELSTSVGNRSSPLDESEWPLAARTRPEQPAGRGVQTPTPETLLAAHSVARIGAAFRRHRPPVDPLFANELLLWHEIVRDVSGILLDDDNALQAERLTAASGWVGEETVRELLTEYLVTG